MKCLVWPPAHYRKCLKSVQIILFLKCGHNQCRNQHLGIIFFSSHQFNVQEWLDSYSTSFIDRSTFLHQIWRGILLCGPKPSLELEILLEVT